MNVAVSACLLGFNCRYDGKGKKDALLKARLEHHMIFPVCPEQLGGLPTPRPACEIKGGNGLDVLEGRAQVVDSHGDDQTGHFIKGAKAVLLQIQSEKIEKCFLKAKSPSCGSGRWAEDNPDSDPPKGYRAVLGVTSALLSREGITIEEIP